MKACSSILCLQALMRRGVIITASAGLALFGAGPTFVMASGPQPNIHRITPNVTSAGGPGFTLVVNGPGFVASSVVQWNGARRPSSFDSVRQELKAAIPASDIAAAGVARITVLNPDGRLSAPATLVIASRDSDRVTPKRSEVQVLGPAPVLVSVSPSVVAQGARQVRLTLVGDNFRPGARVVISSAADIKIESVTRISSTVINAVITVGDRAGEGVRTVDVINTDGTTTGPRAERPGSSQPLHVTSHSSLGAPLGVQTVVITYPRSGTVLSRGDRVFAQAILGGTGSGTITGQWVLDNNVTEQFAVPMTGGGRVLLKTAQSLPTFNLGLHKLELRITGPNLLESRPVEIVVNPGEWKLMRLIAPRSGAGFTPDSPPLLRWDIVPGAAAYQVGFSAKPFFNAVDEWHDVNDTQWRVPGKIWSTLPEGELYWTVRVVETSGQTREPASMRRIRRVATGALAATRATPARTSGGTTLLEWEGLGKDVVYRVTVSRDLEGRDIVRRFFVSQPNLDLRSIEASFQPGRTYYWLVEAYSPKGGLIIAGPRHSFIVDSKPDTPKQIKLVRYEQDSRSPSSVTPNDRIASRTPAPNEKVADARPLVRVDFKTGAFPSELALAVDGTDVTALAEATESSISFKPVIPLKNGEHEITITIGAESDSWRFVVEQREESVTTSNAITAGTQAETEQPPAPEEAAPPATSGGAGKTADAGSAGFTMEAGSNTQLVSGSESETNTLSLAVKEAQQRGAWRIEVNGTGTLNSVLGPSEGRQSLGRFNDYIIRMAGDGKLWGGDVRFGLISPTVFKDSEFITTAFARLGIESTLRTPVGAVGFYHNTGDLAPGGGTGTEFHQEIRGVTYTAPLPKERAVLQLMSLDARDAGTPVVASLATAGAGDAEGALLVLHLRETWVWTSEYAMAHNNLNTLLPSSRALFGRAWRSAITGTLGKTVLNLSYRDVSSNYATPINPSLSQGGNGNRRGLDFSATSSASIGNFTLTYNFLQSDVRRSDRPGTSLHNVAWNWSKSVTATTEIAIGGLDTQTQTGKFPSSPASVTLKVDLSRIGFNTSVTQRIGAMTFVVTGSRDWSRDQVLDKQNVITSAINASANWRVKSFFQLDSNFSANWTAGEPFSAGSTRTITTYIQPMLTWQRAFLSITPLVSVTKTITRLGSNQLTADTLEGNYSGRLSWQMPGQLKFSTLGVDAGWMRSRDGVIGTGVTTPRLLVLWTLVGGISKK